MKPPPEGLSEELSVSVFERVANLPWDMLATSLHSHGQTLGPRLVTDRECGSLVGAYDDEALYRSTINMQRYRFGSGEYRYFARPLPPLVDELRRAFWPLLVPIARVWWEQLGRECPWPDDFDEWIETCASAGQTRPTPLILKYGQGDWNALHRDLYGDVVFPLQVVIGLNEPNVDYTGGEFVTVEQRPRAQSVARSTAIPKGCPLIFTTRDHPGKSVRGYTANAMRHGVSEIHSGNRHALGLLFHDAT
jgi:uncharacterized protein